MYKKKISQRSRVTKVVACVLTQSCLIATIQNACAQEDSGARSSSGLEQVVVTAQRKSELVQEIPLSVNVVTAAALEQKGLSSTEDLQAAVPGLAFVSTGGAGTPFLRGVGSNAGNPNDEPSVATYIDGVYIASPYSNIMSFNNLERVEVLKGPQGTLFGRNATGGVIQLITRDPSHVPGLEISAGYANYATASGSLYATGEITESLAADIAIQGEVQDEGWGYNAIRQQDTYESKNSSVRSKFLYTPTGTLEIRLALDYAELENNMVDYRPPKGVAGIDGVAPTSDNYDTRTSITTLGGGTRSPKVIERQAGVALTVSYDTDLVQFVSTSAFRDNSGVYWAEADMTPLPVVEAKLPIFQSNYSQEFQLLSNADSWLDWTVGAYFYGSRAGYRDLVFSGLGLADPPFSGIGRLEIYSKQETESQSVYAQGDAEIFEATTLTAGVRFTHERQELYSKVFGVHVPDPKDAGFDEPTWRLALDHGFSDDVHAYISYNRGVKGGGFDLLSPGREGYEPETLDAYEIGLKSEWLDNRLRFNAAYFYYDYKDIQVQVIPAGQGGGIVQTTNAGLATIHGLDIDFEYVPIDDLSISGGLVLENGEYDKFRNTVSYPASALTGPSQIIDASGNDTIRTPEVSGNLTVTYAIQSSMGTFPLSLSYSHTGDFFFGADNRLEQDAYGLVNASVGWQSVDERYGVTVWGRNLTDEYYLIQGVPSSTGDLTAPGAPLTYGVTVNAKFGG